jgi:lysophospholipase L1-like esterase
MADHAVTPFIDVPESKSLAPRNVLGGQPAATRQASLTFAGFGGTSISDGVKLGESSVVQCTAVRNCGGFRFVYGNWAKNGEREPANAITVKAGLARGTLGTEIYPVYFGGQEKITITRGAYAVSDVIPFEALRGTVFYARTYVSVAEAGMKWALDRTTVAANNEGVTPTNVDKSQTEGITGSAGTCYSPVAILAVSPITTVPVIAQIGDSIISGNQDTPVDLGWFNRALNAEWAYLNFGKGGGTAKQWSEPASSEGRMQIIDACSHAVVAYGINDLAEGRTAFQVQENLQTIYERLHRRGIRTYGVTILPRTTASTDGYTTVAGQTTASYNAERIAVNEWIRTTPLPLKGVIDAAAAVESSFNSGKWKVPAYTEEGLHPLPTGHAAIAESFSPALVTK